MPGVGRRSRRISSPHPLRGFGGRSNRKSCSFDVSTVTPGGVDEVQTVTLTGSPGSGNFTLTFRGATTGNIAYNAASSAVEDALELLATIGNGNVRVTGSAGGPYTVTFINDLGKQGVDQMTANGGGLGGGTTPGVTVTTVTEGSDADAGRLFVRRGLIIMLSGTTKVKAWDGNSADDIIGVLAQDYEWISGEEQNDADLSYWGGPGCDFLAKNLIGYGNGTHFKTWASTHGCVVTEGTI
jgi:hypothetical protein